MTEQVLPSGAVHLRVLTQESFVNGKNSKLTMNSDVIICPGSVAAYNGGQISLSGRSGTVSELWTDNIVIGGKASGSIKSISKCICI